MRTETLYSSYHPIQQYRQLLTHMLGEDTHPVLELRAIDAFLMKQMVRLKEKTNMDDTEYTNNHG